MFIIKFVVYGFIWLFIFSIPFGSKARLFDFLYVKIVQSKTAKEALNSTHNIYEKTASTAHHTVTEFNHTLKSKN